MIEDAESPVDASRDVSLREAARLYVVELSTLRRLVRLGRMRAYKARGPWGREWRVPRASLEAYGYVCRNPEVPAPRDAHHVSRLERDLADARRTAAAERTRADEADRRLGEALLQAGRLRAELLLARGVGPSDDPADDDLPPGEAHELHGCLVDLRVGGSPAKGR